MADNKQHDTRTTRRPDCVTEIRMGNSVLVVSGYFKKDTTDTAADKYGAGTGSGSRRRTQAQLSPAATSRTVKNRQFDRR